MCKLCPQSSWFLKTNGENRESFLGYFPPLGVNCVLHFWIDGESKYKNSWFGFRFLIKYKGGDLGLDAPVL